MVAAHCASFFRWGPPPFCCSGFTQIIPPTKFSPEAIHHAYYCNIVLSHEIGCWQYEKQTRTCCYWVCECVFVGVCALRAVSGCEVVGSGLFVQLLNHCLPGLHTLTHTHNFALATVVPSPKQTLTLTLD